MSIENQYVSFVVVKRNDDGLIYKRVSILLILSSLFVGYIPENFLGSTGQLVLIGSIVTVIIALGIKSYGIKGYDEIGQVTLFPEHIQVVENNETKEILIEDLDVLAFAYSGYRGQPVFGRTGHSKDGLNNLITIRSQAYGRDRFKSIEFTKKCASKSMICAFFRQRNTFTLTSL